MHDSQPLPHRGNEYNSLYTAWRSIISLLKDLLYLYHENLWKPLKQQPVGFIDVYSLFHLFLDLGRDNHYSYLFPYL